MLINETDVLLKIVNESDENLIKRQEQESWEKIYAARQNRSILKARLKGIETIQDKLCGVVWIGDIKGLIPFEYAGVEKKRDLRNMVGQEVYFKVTALDRQGETFVGSRKDAVDHLQGLTWDMLRKGQKVMAKIIRVQQRDLILDVGAIEVSLNAKEISHEWIDDLHDKFKVGEEIMVRVLELNKKDKLLKVSHKELLANPWPDCAKRFQVYNEYVGKVSGVMEFGVFINLAPGVDALATQPSPEIGRLQKGDEVLVKIFAVKIKEQEITAKITKKL